LLKNKSTINERIFKDILGPIEEDSTEYLKMIIYLRYFEKLFSPIPFRILHEFN